MGSETEKKEARLLGEFDYPTYEQWREVAEKSLKGAPFEKKLLTKTYEGITLKPVYNADSTSGLAHMGALPGFTPYVRGGSAAGSSASPWRISQDISCPTPSETRAALKQGLERGQSGIRLTPDEAGRDGIDPDHASPGDVGSDGISIVGIEDIATILDGIDLKGLPLAIDVGSAGVPIAAMLIAYVREGEMSPNDLEGYIENDPLGTLARKGAFPRPIENVYDEMAALAAWAEVNAPGLRTVNVAGHPYHDGGGSAVEELAYALATGTEYIRALIERGLSVDAIAPRIAFSFSVGANFFMEVSKLRAARLLWSRIIEAFGGSEAARKMEIHARSSAWNKTAFDPYVNMLRATTEAFSAAVAGAESITTAPFDSPVRQPDDFSRRIARNVQVVLQEESHVNQVVDPAGGSWYVEHLTDEVASRAWALFQKVEKAGGMYAALSAEMPQQKIAETAAARAKDLDTRKSVFIGTNIFPNATEKPLEQREPDKEALLAERGKAAKAARDKSDQSAELAKLSGADSGDLVEAAIEAAANGATLGQLSQALAGEGEQEIRVTPLNIHRGAERHEKMRRAVDQYAAESGKRPQVFLANMGPIPQHKPRADFSTGFFQVGGFEVLGNNGFATPEAAADAAATSGAEVAVICSTDDTYPALVPPFMARLSEKGSAIKIVLAGYPKAQINDHKQSGVNEFIHLRANNYEILAGFLEEIGIAL